MKIQLLAVTLLMCSLGAARAELKWDTTVIVLHPAAGDKEAVGHFKYQNTGTEPIHFTSLRASCGCTTAQSQKEEVAAGEQGEITAKFNIGDRVGLQVKTIEVQTDDPAHAVTVLKLKTVLPELLEINPVFVYWKKGEAVKPKTIFVGANKVVAVNQLKVSSSNSDFQTSVERVDKEKFKIDVTPKTTTYPMVTTLAIQPEGLAKTFYVNARVTEAPPAR